MNVKLFLIVSVFVLLGCNSQSGKTSAQDCKVNYESYYNERYDYGVDYPDFLIPQGEAESEDGQTFTSEDNKEKMIVYRTFKAITGDNPTIESAFEEDLEFSENVTEKQLFDNYYFVKGKKDENTLYKQYTILANDDYFVIYFEYSIDDEELFECVSQQVSESFHVGMGEGEIHAVSAEFTTFIQEFVDNCYLNVNFNTLLRNKDSRLSKYIDSKMDIRRYYNPGSIAYLYTRADNFGFDEYTDFSTKISANGEFALYPLENSLAPCDIDFSDNNKQLYYASVESVPEVVVNTETFEMAPVEVPYPEASIIVVYLPNYFKGNPTSPRAFYFVETPSGWKLAFVDDSLCSA